MAIATDCNPGTSPLTSLLLAMNMGATLFGLTVEECLLGATVHAARALGLAGTVGQLARAARRPGDLECRAPGRSCSRDGRRAAPCPHLEWKMSPVVSPPAPPRWPIGARSMPAPTCAAR
jgi:hypothetical protein